jgi:hypothetical protein
MDWSVLMTTEIAVHLVEDFKGTTDAKERHRKQLLYYHLIMQAIASGYGFPYQLAQVALSLNDGYHPLKDTE